MSRSPKTAPSVWLMEWQLTAAVKRQNVTVLTKVSWVVGPQLTSQMRRRQLRCKECVHCPNLQAV